MKNLKINKNLFTGILSIAVIIGIIILGIYIAKLLTKKYIYVDMYGTTGTSQRCYYDNNSRDLRCTMNVKVQQYTEE